MVPTQDISAYVLAGGKSSRMGQDKGLMEIEGRPMVSYVLDLLAQLDIETKLIAHQNGYKELGRQVIPDLIPEQGPMGGLHTALEDNKKPYLLLLSCDMPFLPKEAVQKLLGAVKEQDVVAAEIKGRMNPLFAVYKGELKEKVKENLASGKLRMQEFIKECEHEIVRMEELVDQAPKRFLNINTPEDLEKSSELWKKQH
jgi:molybdenum cofactor guanylyltransferase